MRSSTALAPRFGARLAAVTLFSSLIVALPTPASAAPVVETLSFFPVADAYVKALYPDSNFGSSTSLYVDRKDARESLIKFNVSGLDGYRISDVRLRLYQKDVSPSGGRVYEFDDHSWSESTLTWNTRPQGYKANGVIAEFGAVQKGVWYETSLGPIVDGSGLVSLALDSANSDGANWGSRTSATPPALEVDIVEDDANVRDGVSQVAPPSLGSSEPTYHGTQHRVALTEGGRLLAVHGRHATGVQLAWRNPWGPWRNDTTGSVSDGILLRGTGTGDWSASIALEEDPLGEQHAWVVWAGPAYGSPKPLQMRRLSGLDAPGGPTVGPIVTIAPPGVSGQTGNSKVDLGFETAPDGSPRGVITWTRRTGASSWELAYTWFTDLDTDTPSFAGEGTFFSYSGGSYHGTLTPTPDGISWIGRAPTGSMRMFRHDSDHPLTSWTQSNAGIGIGSGSYPSATTLASGDILAVVESSTASDIVKVQRFTPSGPQPAVAFPAGYAQPTIASDGNEAWIIMIRTSDNTVVSRHFDGTSWSTTDRVEMGLEDGSGYAWPNAVRTTDGRLRFIVEGPTGGPAQNAVLAFQRLLSQ
ncbi:MAG: DNRLRE domain-containing protein [Actinomycetota bacterium]|nr:DNRLRE domain-containing protein [Actinomycetota bacterium]